MVPAQLRSAAPYYVVLLLAHFQLHHYDRLRRPHVGIHQESHVRANSPVRHDRCLRESARQQGQGRHLHRLQRRGRGRCAHSGGIPPGGHHGPVETLEMDVLRLRAVHKQVIAKVSSVKTWITKKEGDERVVGFFSSGREFTHELGMPFGEEASDESSSEEVAPPDVSLRASCRHRRGPNCQQGWGLSHRGGSHPLHLHLRLRLRHRARLAPRKAAQGRPSRRDSSPSPPTYRTPRLPRGFHSLTCHRLINHRLRPSPPPRAASPRPQPPLPAAARLRQRRRRLSPASPPLLLLLLLLGLSASRLVEYLRLVLKAIARKQRCGGGSSAAPSEAAPGSGRGIGRGTGRCRGTGRGSGQGSESDRGIGRGTGRGSGRGSGQGSDRGKG